MAITPGFIADKSALERVRHSAVDALLTPLVQSGQMATCGIVELEVLFSSRSHEDFLRTRRTRGAAFPEEPMLQTDLNRATDVMGLLAKAGKHRAASIPDLLIAAIAERSGLTILHYDGDYDHIASVTGQPVEWVAPKGTL